MVFKFLFPKPIHDPNQQESTNDLENTNTQSTQSSQSTQNDINPNTTHHESHPTSLKSNPLAKSFFFQNSNNANFNPDLLYLSRDSVIVGQVVRYNITYTPPPPPPKNDSSKQPLPNQLVLKIKNLEAVALRAAFLAGPFVLYVDVTPNHYDSTKKTTHNANKPHYEPQLKPGQSFYVNLEMDHENSPEIKTYSWTVDIVSQIVFSNSSRISFQVSIGLSKQALQHSGLFSSSLSTATNTPSSTVVSTTSTSLSTTTSTSTSTTLPHSHHNPLTIFGPSSENLSVTKLDTHDLWSSPAPRPDPTGNDPLHLVIVTHGLHSNVGADMLYVKEAIDAAARKTGENLIVRGYFGNVRKTEKGVRYLGSRLAEYVVHLVDQINSSSSSPSSSSFSLPKDRVQVKKISFIAHSLGGLVQTYALSHIKTNYPSFFTNVTPVNFIALASPFLGISNENPYFVKVALDMGIVGKTGQDLSLCKNLLVAVVPGKKTKKLPLLEVLPTGPSHDVLKMFANRTLYANAVNDGIVPLRTSAVLYLDWKGLSEVQLAIQDQAHSSAQEKEMAEKINEEKEEGKKESQHTDGKNKRGEYVSEIPECQSDAATELNSAGHHHHLEKESLMTSLSHAVTPVQGIFSLFAPSAHKKSGDKEGEKEEESNANTGNAKGSDENNSSASTKLDELIPNVPKIYRYSQTLPISTQESVISHTSKGNDLITKAEAPAVSTLKKADTEPEMSSTSSEHNKSDSLHLEPNFDQPNPLSYPTSPSNTNTTKKSLSDPVLHQKLTLPKKTSFFESGVSVILPPLPPESFILDPSTRSKTSAIVHDRYYHDYDMPPKRFKHNNSRTVITVGGGGGGGVADATTEGGSLTTSAVAAAGIAATNLITAPFAQSNKHNRGKLSNDHSLGHGHGKGKVFEKEKERDEDKSKTTASNDHANNDHEKLIERSRLEERIARAYHAGLTWRKVLVRLEPDAHNNIVVRRKYANAYGWPIIEHLVNEHFIKPNGGEGGKGGGGRSGSGVGSTKKKSVNDHDTKKNNSTQDMNGLKNGLENLSVQSEQVGDHENPNGNQAENPSVNQNGSETFSDHSLDGSGDEESKDFENFEKEGTLVLDKTLELAPKVSLNSNSNLEVNPDLNPKVNPKANSNPNPKPTPSSSSNSDSNQKTIPKTNTPLKSFSVFILKSTSVSNTTESICHSKSASEFNPKPRSISNPNTNNNTYLKPDPTPRPKTKKRFSFSSYTSSSSSSNNSFNSNNNENKTQTSNNNNDYRLSENEVSWNAYLFKNENNDDDGDKEDFWKT